MHNPPKILIVDDEPFNVDYLEQELEDMNFDTISANNGLETLEQVRAAPPDLILLDIMMPLMDGFEVLSKLKSARGTRDIPVIVISAMSDMDSVVRGIELGAEDYLPKPFDPILLHARLNASLEKKRLRESEKKYLEAIEDERNRSESLLLNILPSTIAEQLKTNPNTIADYFEEATIVFADLVDFTGYSSNLDAKTLVEQLNKIFSIFDELTNKHHLEKIKTIGDSYMAVAGIPQPKKNHVELAANLALDMQQSMKQLTDREGKEFQIRVGLHTGPLVAGVIGKMKFAYDVWGDTVNIASRMESHGTPGEIHVSSSVYQRLNNVYEFKKRGDVEIKGMGKMITYWLHGKKT